MKRKLFAFDLDGTLLSDSETGAILPSVKSAINFLKKEKHIVCIFTGRPWRATKKIYDELKLNTVVVNFNGAHIHNPKDYEYMPFVDRIPLKNAMKILDSKEMKEIAKNIFIEGPSLMHVKNYDKNSSFIKSFLMIDDNSKVTTPINFSSMDNDPSGVLIEVKPEYGDSINEIRSYFKSKFGDLASFTWWSTGEKGNKILEITHYKARKDMALIKVARQYGIDMTDTIAFGDGYNDIKMLSAAGTGVAMSNANDKVKSYANVITKHSNKDGGVAKFIKWYIKKTGYKKVDKTIYYFGKMQPIKDQITADD